MMPPLQSLDETLEDLDDWINEVGVTTIGDTVELRCSGGPARCIKAFVDHSVNTVSGMGNVAVVADAMTIQVRKVDAPRLEHGDSVVLPRFDGETYTIEAPKSSDCGKFWIGNLMLRRSKR